MRGFLPYSAIVPYYYGDVNIRFCFIPALRCCQAGGPPPEKESVEGMEVGQRCEVQPGGRRGIVEFIGEVEGLKVTV